MLRGREYHFRKKKPCLSYKITVPEKFYFIKRTVNNPFVNDELQQMVSNGERTLNEHFANDEQTLNKR
jgi:hypothetical protein